VFWVLCLAWLVGFCSVVLMVMVLFDLLVGFVFVTCFH